MSKAFVTLAAAAVFVAVYEVTIHDSRFSVLPVSLEGGGDPGPIPAPGLRLTFSATAYCKGVVTSSGVAVQSGIAAADPALLPVGSVIEIDVSDDRYSGIYTVLDTGPAVHGREVDIYIWNCNEALRFGARAVGLTVLRLGWDPRATPKSFIERWFKRPESPPPLPSRPLPIAPQ